METLKSVAKKFSPTDYNNMIGASVEGVVSMTLHPVVHQGAAEIGCMKIKGYVQAYGAFYDKVQKCFENR